MNKHKNHLHRIIAISIVTLQALLLVVGVPIKVTAAALPDATASSTPDIKVVGPTGPDVNAQAAIVMDVNTGEILYAKDIYTAYYPASITKVMTALVALENSALTDVMTMTEDAEMNVYGARIGLVRGESITMESALYGMLLESANEVTYGIAEHVGGKMKDFVVMMNERAAELGCVNTHFVNPHGLHEEGHYVCAYDMALIGQAAIKIPEFRKISGTRSYTIPATNKNVARPLAHHHLFIRKTLNYEYAIAGKTGATNEALNTLVTYAEKDGLSLVCVVLRVDTTDHMYEDTITLCNYAFENYTAYNIKDNELGDNATFSSLYSTAIPFPISTDNNILSIDTDSSIVLPNTAAFADATKSVEFVQLDEFSHGNNIIGTVKYDYKGAFVGSADIVYYVEDYPINKAYYAEKWPSYMVDPDYAFTEEYALRLNALLNPEAVVTTAPDTDGTDDGTDAISVTPTVDPTDSTTTDSQAVQIFRKRALIISGAAGLITLLFAGYLIFFELPYRRKYK